jgi:hypothetical protein
VTHKYTHTHTHTQDTKKQRQTCIDVQTYIYTHIHTNKHTNKHKQKIYIHTYNHLKYKGKKFSGQKYLASSRTPLHCGGTRAPLHWGGTRAPLHWGVTIPPGPSRFLCKDTGERFFQPQNPGIVAVSRCAVFTSLVVRAFRGGLGSVRRVAPCNAGRDLTLAGYGKLAPLIHA